MPKHKPKYKNTKTYIDGIRFDSKAEAKRYLILKSMEDEGLIRNLELQPEFEILPSYKKNGRTIRAVKYRADFAYFRGDERVVEDVKGMATPVFLLKKKLVEYFFRDVTITIVR